MPSGPRPVRRLQAALRRFAGQESGVATIEFVFFAPLIFVMIYAMAEFTNATDNRHKVNTLARTLADLVSQDDTGTISSDTMKQILASATPVLAPFAASQATVKLYAVGVYDGTKAVVCSSYPTMSDKDRKDMGGTLTIPKNFQRGGARYIISQVTMPYQPLLGQALARLVKTIDLNFTWTETIIWPVREGMYAGWVSQGSFKMPDKEVVFPNGAYCPSGGL